jgi:hypothetical protein
LYRNGGCQRLSGGDFAENCYVPCDNWSTLSNDELTSLLSPLGALCSNAVTVLNIVPSLLDEFRERVLLALLRSTESGLNRRIIGDFTERLLKDLHRRYHIRRIRELGVDLNFSPACSPSTAFNFETQRFMGMHIDNHERLPLAARGEAFQLLNINLGRADRYFCFVDREVAALAELLGIAEEVFEAEYRHYTSKMKDLFMSRHADYPIIRIRIPPGCAYVATTQNLIHDGATNTEGESDITLLVSGRFEFDNMET